MDVLKKIFNDFMAFNFIDYISTEFPDEYCIAKWYESNAGNTAAIEFIKNYQFPKNFENYSIKPYISSLHFFFANPYCFGKITNFLLFYRLFMANPEKFIGIYKNNRNLFDFEYPTTFFSVTPIDLSRYSLEIQTFYEQYIFAPVLEQAKNLSLNKQLDINSLANIMSEIVNSKILDQIVEKYIPIFTLIIAQFFFVLPDVIINENTKEFFLKYPELIIAIFGNNPGYFNAEQANKLKNFFIALPIEVLDFIEKEYSYLKFKNKNFSHMFPPLLYNPNLSYQEHPKIYKRAVIEFVRLQMFFSSYDEPINVPEEIVDKFTPEEAYKIAIYAENIQGYLINLPIEKLIEKATAYVITNPHCLDKLKRASQTYQNLKNPQNAKNIKILFYQYCLNKIKNRDKNIPFLLREIYDDFSKENEMVAIQLIEEIISNKECNLKNDIENFETKIFNLKKESYYKKDNNVFDKYKDIICKICGR